VQVPLTIQGHVTMTRRTFSVLVGGLFWVGLVGLLVVLSRGLSVPVETSPAGLADGRTSAAAMPIGQQLLGYWTTSPRSIELTLPEVAARDGDPIFARTPEGRWIQAGYLIETDSSSSATRATAIWHTSELTPEECRLEYHRNRGKFADVVKLLLPPEKRDRVEAIIRKSVETDGKEIIAAMRPILNRSMKESLPVIERAFRDSIARHRPELEQVGERYRTTVLDERLVPLLKEEVLPIVKEHTEPLAQQIGREMWDRASVWRFGWRFLYDRTPLPDRDLVKREWDRFVEEEAIPILESHTGDMIEAQKTIVREISESEKVREVLSEIATDISRDQELRSLVTAILRESIVDNVDLRRVWMDNWQSIEAKAAFQLAGDRLEPVVREIADELFGTRDSGISPSFARVLRNQILGKDKRWLLAFPSDGTSPIESETRQLSEPFRVIHGDNDLPYPLIIMAAPEESL
jgi:hypothetical protein